MASICSRLTRSSWSWHPRQDDFDHGLALLRRFVEREKTARVPFDHVEDGFALGRWVRKRRQLHAEGLRLRRDALLEDLPGWTWDPYSDQFEKGIAFLRQFVRREGHAQVPADHLEYAFRLGKWVVKRRQAYRAGKLTRDRAVRLEAFPGWLWTAPRGPRPRR
jgi:hypothetical protein